MKLSGLKIGHNFPGLQLHFIFIDGRTHIYVHARKNYVHARKTSKEAKNLEIERMKRSHHKLPMFIFTRKS